MNRRYCDQCHMSLEPDDEGRCPVCDPVSRRWLWAVVLGSVLVAVFTVGGILQYFFPVD